MSSARKGALSTPGNRAELLPELKRELGKNGNLSKESMSEVAVRMGLPLNEVYAVSSFYTYMPLAPAGKNIIRVCGCLPCELKEEQGVIGIIKKEIGIGPGQSTADGKFSVEVVGCIGACDQAPAMMINYKLYGSLTEVEIARILKTY